MRTMAHLGKRIDNSLQAAHADVYSDTVGRIDRIPGVIADKVFWGTNNIVRKVTLATTWKRHGAFTSSEASS